MINDYFDQALQLLPRGLIWGRAHTSHLAATLWMAAGGLVKAHLRAENLINEAIPQTAVELLGEWEAFAGLPDECTPERDLTLSERQDAVVEKLTGLGSLSVASFYALAVKLGYEITIREYRPFICGRSVCGGPDVLGAAWPADGEEDGYNARYYWRVTVHGPRAHWFRCGRNTAGERLGWYSPAKELECFFNRRKPAHTIIIFDYQEAI
jgi:uncharacterized protein YmfQ (DUF2313 family)